MKRIINHTPILATLFIAAGSLYAQEGFAPRDEKAKGTLKAAVNQMVISIERSLGIFEGLNRSTRHKSGIAMRFPRISRLRWDKPAAEADRLETLQAMLPGEEG